MLENLWKGGDNDRATVDWRWKSTQREVFDRCSRDSSPFSSLLPSFFFSSPVFSNHHHHHRKLSWSAKHFFPWIWMRADAWNEARGSSVESFLMTERNDSSNLMEEGRTTTTTPPPQLFTPNFSDLLANLDASFSMSSTSSIELVKILRGKIFWRGLVSKGRERELF